MPNPIPASAASTTLRAGTSSACWCSASRTARAIPAIATMSPATCRAFGCSPRATPTATGTTAPIEAIGATMLIGPLAIAA